MARAILVSGSTGKQGGALIDALISSPQASEFTIYALTRSPSSSSAKKLAAKSDRIKLLQGDLDDTSAIFKAAPEPIWGVFSVQTPNAKGGAEGEERQGKALIDSALAAGVQHFVYTSVDRGGDARSPSNPTNVPHFISKHNIEQHLLAKTRDSAMTYTILRPVAFYDNFTADFFGKVMPTAWRVALPSTKPLQMIAAEDIGKFAAKAFLQPEQWSGRATAIAGDELTFAQANAVFREKTGHDFPLTYSFLARVLLFFVKELGYMFTWFKNEGYGADVEACRKEVPDLLDFAAWVETRSAWKKN